MAYLNGATLANAAARLRYSVKFGLIALADRFMVDDAGPNNWKEYADNQAGTGKLHYLTGVDTNNQTLLNNYNGVKMWAIEVPQSATPTAPTITNAGTTGATTYTYKVVARNGFGVSLGTTPASSAGSTTTGNATLSSTNYNVITWPFVSGAGSYDIYRTVGGATQGKIGNVLAAVVPGTGVQSPTFALNDTGLAGDGTTAPTTNTTGSVSIPVFSGSITVPVLTTPVGVVATPQGTAGSTTITYKIVARAGAGVTAASSAGTTTTANATLSASNNVLVTWDPVPGAISYDVYRTAAGGTPSTTGLIANVLTSTGNSYTDTGAAGDSSTAPTVNTTGQFTTAGPVTVGQLVENMTDQAIASSTTITAVNMIGGILRVTTGTDTSTTDTAANIVAAIPGCQVGSTFRMVVVNGSGATHTVGLGSGVTAAAGVTVTLTTATANSKEFLFRVTNVGTPAVTIYSLGTSTS